MKGHLTQAEAKLHWQSKDIHTEKRVVKKKKKEKWRNTLTKEIGIKCYCQYCCIYRRVLLCLPVPVMLA